MSSVSSSHGSGDVEFPSGVRSVELHLPEDEGEGLGFQLTRTLWDPYPWVRDVSSGSLAASAGLKVGDCLLQVDGQDLLGITVRCCRSLSPEIPRESHQLSGPKVPKVGRVAGMIRGDGDSRVVALLVWNCGVDPSEDPELLFSCGGLGAGERARRVVSSALRAIACAVCAATVPSARCCPHGHVFCAGCYSRLAVCALCRAPLPPAASPQARNLVAEQIYEAIATEYKIKSAPMTSSARASPRASPAPPRRQYQLSMHRPKRNVTFDRGSCASDPNIHRTVRVEDSQPHPPAATCNCRLKVTTSAVPRRLLSDARHCQVSQLSRSLNNIHVVSSCCANSGVNHSGSLDNLKTTDILNQDAPVLILPTPPIYLLACEHEKTK